MSAELEKLLNSVYDKSDNTKRSYKVQYNKFLKTLNDLDMPPAIHLNSQQKLLDIALEQPKANSQQALINIAILVRRLYGLDVKILVAARVFIRNVYKTEGTYGQKVNTILDVDFRHALKMVAQHQKHNEDAGVFTSGQEQIGYYIKKATYKNIGEGAYMKIIIDATRGDLQKLKQISENRGTRIKTLIENYDLANQ